MNSAPINEETIFLGALEKDAPEQRDAFLDGACADNPQLRQRIEALLQSHEETDDFLKNPPVNLDAISHHPAITEGPGTKIGRYKLLQQIGEGGMGVVYMAEQREPVLRRVALKIIKLGMDTKQVIGRFEAERQALAMMDHPNIAKVLDAGSTETGRPYFVMELVKGVPITEFCDQNKFSTRQRLELFVAVCNAVQHAHQKGIIHRDLKPSNVMVTLHDDRPVPKVIDFGIAKATQHRLTEKTVFTEFKQLIGTPAYMSPEQATFSGLDIDTRSDIYTLGVLLYEVLTGTPPFDEETLRGVAYDELCRIIREEAPPTPSTRLRALGDELAVISKSRATEPGLLKRLLRGEVDWIVMKALEKDRVRRYDTANSLARDIQRYLGNQPVLAGPPTAAYRLRKFVARNRTAVVASAVVAAALVVGTVAATVGFVEANKERKTAVKARRETDRANTRLQEQLTITREAREEYRRLLYVSDMGAVREAWDDDANLARVVELLERHRPHEMQKDLRGFQWYYYWQLSRRGATVRTFQHSTPVYQAVFSSDGNRLATGGNAVTLWDLTAPERKRRLGSDIGAFSVAFSPDDRTLMVSGAGPAEGLRFWDLATGKSTLLLSDGAPVAGLCMALSPDGKMLAAASLDNETTIWDVQSRSLVRRLHRPSDLVLSMAFSADGTMLASGSVEGTLKLWDVATGAEPDLLDGDPPRTFSVAFSSQRMLATGGTDGTIRLWDLDTGRNLHTLIGHRGMVMSVAFSPDGGLLASGGKDNTARLWDVTTGKLLDTLKGHANFIRSVRFSPDGKSLATASMDATVKLWDIGRRRPTFLTEPSGMVTNVAYFPQGNRLISSSGDAEKGEGKLELWDAATGKQLDTFEVPYDVLSVAASADGRTVAAGTRRGDVILWDMAAREQVGVLAGHKLAVWSVAFSPDGAAVASASHDCTVKLWDVDSGELQDTFKRSEVPFEGVAFSPDGKILAAGHFDSTINLWNVQTRELKVLKGHVDIGFGLAFSPDGQTLASGGIDSKIILWDLSGGLQGASAGQSVELLGHGGAVWGLAFSPDGKTLASAGGDATVKLWDVVKREVRANFKEHKTQVGYVAFSPDGHTLMSCTRDGEIILRRAASRAEVKAAGW